MKISVRKERKAKSGGKPAGKVAEKPDRAEPAKAKAPRRDDAPKKARQDDRPKKPRQNDAPKKPTPAAKVQEKKPPVVQDSNEADDGWNGPMPSFLDAKLNR